MYSETHPLIIRSFKTTAWACFAKTIRARLVVGVFSSLAAIGLATLMVRGGVGPLAPNAEAQVAEPLARLPAHPYQKSTGDAYARFVFGANVPENLVVEVRGIFIKGGGQSQLPALAGPALLEVKNGAGTISLRKRKAGEGDNGDHKDGGSKRALVPLNLTKLDMDDLVTLNNTGEQPLVVQLYLFEAK